MQFCNPCIYLGSHTLHRTMHANEVNQYIQKTSLYYCHLYWIHVCTPPRRKQAIRKMLWPRFTQHPPWRLIAGQLMTHGKVHLYTWKNERLAWSVMHAFCEEHRSKTKTPHYLLNAETRDPRVELNSKTKGFHELVFTFRWLRMWNIGPSNTYIQKSTYVSLLIHCILYIVYTPGVGKIFLHHLWKSYLSASV